MDIRARGKWGRSAAQNAAPGASVQTERAGAVGAWLDLLCRLLRLPREQTESIRVELEEHLRERVRDLMLEGQPEDAASRRAIEELGDAAVLADRFRRAEHTPRRRMLMNIAMLGMAVGAVVLGTTALNRNAPPQIGAALPTETRLASKDVADKSITLAKDATLGKLVEEIGHVSGHSAHAYWDKLAEAGFEEKAVIGVPLSGVTIEMALMIANERLAKMSDRIACRMTGDMLEVSTLGHFDKREITLVAYDVSGVLYSFAPAKQPAQVSQELQELIIHVVEPEQWRENGGELAEFFMVGSKMFVKAPARFHPTVQWILGQLGAGKAAAAPQNGLPGVPILSDIPIIGGTFTNQPKPGSDGKQSLQPDADRMTFTARNSQVTAERAGGGSITADKLVISPSKDTIEATAKGAITVSDGPKSSAAMKEDLTRVNTYSITGQVEHPGVYCLPKDGLTLRRAIVAGGGKFEGVREVVVTQTENGLVNVVHRLTGNELRAEGAKDPMLADGQIIEVK